MKSKAAVNTTKQPRRTAAPPSSGTGPVVVLLPILPGEFLTVEKINDQLRGSQNDPKVRAMMAVIEQAAVRAQGESQSQRNQLSGLGPYMAGGAEALATLLEDFTEIIYQTRRDAGTPEKP